MSARERPTPDGEEFDMHTLLVKLDLVGTFVFALSGAVVEVRHRLDLFGVMGLSLAASTAGGVARDMLIGVSLLPRSATGGISPPRFSRD
jgi:uncharacterized membrane protein YeiH